MLESTMIAKINQFSYHIDVGAKNIRKIRALRICFVLTQRRSWTICQ
ncbi:hypothetical protein [Dubosiella newyorkensis]